jgi:hypothetical protein
MYAPLAVSFSAVGVFTSITYVIKWPVYVGII